MPKSKVPQIPQSVLQAVDVLTSPYGIKFVPQQKPTDETIRRYFDVRSATMYSSLSRWTLARAVKDRELTCMKIGKGQTGKILFDRKELTRFLESHKTRRQE